MLALNNQHMPKKKPEPTHGGHRPGAGRKPIEGARLIPRTVTLTGEQWNALEELGAGNISAGIRALVDALKKG